MHDNLSGRAAELAHLNDLIRTSLSLADATIPLLNEQLHALAEMGIDNLELEGPRIYSRTAGWSPAFDDEQIIFAAALTMPGGLGCTVWSADDYTTRYGDSHHEPPVLRERFVVYDKLPPPEILSLKVATFKGGRSIAPAIESEGCCCDGHGHPHHISEVAARCRDHVPVDVADPPAHGDGRESRPTGTVPEGIVPSRAQLELAAAGLEPATPGL